MSASQISLSMLARSAYRTPGPQAQNDKPAFREELSRQTVKNTSAVSIELSDAARSALLALQEISAARSEIKTSTNQKNTINLDGVTADFDAAIPVDVEAEANAPNKPASERINIADPFAAPKYEQPGGRLNLSI